MSLDLKVLIVEGGAENFVLSINYCQLNVLITFSILYHLVKAFMICPRNIGIFSIAELIVLNIFFPQILYLNGRNFYLKYKTLSLLQFSKANFSCIRPRKGYIFNFNDPEGVKYLTRLRLRFSHLNEQIFRHDFLDTLNPM